MTGRVDSLWRYPVKAHGRERIGAADLTPGQCLPWDRTWAVAHEDSTADGSDWARCSNFMRAAKAPGLQAMTCILDEASETVTFDHPDLGSLTAHPERDADRLIAWTAPLQPEGRSASARVVRATARGMTDCDHPTITLCNLASHRAVSQKAGADLSIHRWRGNAWIDGLAPWEEFDWVGQRITLGTATLEVLERTERCLMTHANPDTGKRDIPLLDVLDTWGHRDFSVQAVVVTPGHVADGDAVVPA
ncbi:MOSC domain-containing protein [Pseudaestuariivita atlantica]|uniref:Molybdenum cofactor biosysynthesis protein n=1 Tax=Pseudaestuariivita atlantica TaxID=1317121 RepID=A0A0L1JKM1_9RHOB|nr:MOSC N-terminal beta barrel domain-containing protein [Pseudaestuariivita atlantica]KNG92301.1 molybdenum cofactor biosysynthesis protein [Pseudaestuariivita atlantica]